MARSFIRYTANGSPHWGELAGAAPKTPNDSIRVYRLSDEFTTIAQLVAALEAGRDLGRAVEVYSVPGKDVLSPVTTDATVICQGMNYYSHTVGDAGFHERKDNLIFWKASSSLCGPYDNIVKPAEAQMLDYEIEVGLIFRQPLKEGAQVNAENLGDYVAGAVLCNDISARDVMFGATYMQWTRGKGYRTFLPAGPVFYWLEKNEVAEKLEHFRITLDWRNKQCQNGVTSDMIFKPAETLTFLATIMDLKQGDLLLTGTPGGVIAKGTPKINQILKDYLLDDAQRYPLMVAEALATVSDFIQPGDVITANMFDETCDLDLGGQYSVVV